VIYICACAEDEEKEEEEGEEEVEEEEVEEVEEWRFHDAILFARQ
jgi:hypothetical protein